MKLIAQISRVLVGVLFIISGLIKANDPLGFSYKLDEYFQVFGMPWLSFTSLALAIAICAFEIGLGVALLLGARMVHTTWSLLIMIVFFTFLTFYSWKFDVVKDCGCFGDALKLTPFESFMKDVVLLILILFIFFKRHEIKPLFGEKPSLYLAYAGFAASLFFSIYCYRHLPVVDFRPYAVGENIRQGMTLPPDAVRDSVVMVFIYEKDGKQIELDMEGIKSIDETYKFIDRKDKVVREGDKPKIADFSIVDADGNDMTDDVLDLDAVFLLVAYDINKTDKAVQNHINDFVALSTENKIPFIGLTASADKEVQAFRHEHNSMFDYYNADATALKTMIRSNPGLMLLRKGTVKAMWHHNDFPSFDEVKKEHFN
ncbi:MAG: DoxX family protein [Bacteroidetes bacterium]|nr:MAG: DoxX family protein [Bacteroidota bacterium]REK08042.1 MAG: DoxX family protein [Bacteroidota bacterium]REK32247.1 MAG: DoxX family protein [Bacteroidota bacterium]REK47399.1 MAG: DoxX family protein [Bacteroidota bacterium]